MTESETTFPKTTRKKFLLIIAGLSLFNIIVYTIFIRTDDTLGNFGTALIGFLFGFPILSFILGLLVALLPYKRLEYEKKYLRASLLSLLSLNILLTICSILIIIWTAIGWLPAKKTDQAVIDTPLKQQAETNFKLETRALCDSINFYADLASSELQRGDNPDSISKKLSTKVVFFQEQLEIKSNTFIDNAKNVDITNAEIKKLIEDLGVYLQPTKDKLRKLNESGLDIHTK